MHPASITKIVHLLHIWENFQLNQIQNGLLTKISTVVVIWELFNYTKKIYINTHYRYHAYCTIRQTRVQTLYTPVVYRCSNINSIKIYKFGYLIKEWKQYFINSWLSAFLPSSEILKLNNWKQRTNESRNRSRVLSPKKLNPLKVFKKIRVSNEHNELQKDPRVFILSGFSHLCENNILTCIDWLIPFSLIQ